MNIRIKRPGILFGFLLSALALAGQAHAQTQTELDAAVGQVTVDVQCPQSGFIQDGGEATRTAGLRSARIAISKPGLGYQDWQIQGALLHMGAKAAWAQCPITTPIYGLANATTDDEHVGSAEIYGAPCEGCAVRLLLRADTYDPSIMRWMHVVDTYQRDSDQAAELAQRQAASAQAAYQAQQNATQEAQDEQTARARMAAWDAWWGGVWRVIKLIFFLGIAAWLATKWETFVRWYYQLTPHPAANMVQAALSRGVELDGEAFNEILRPIPGGRIGKAVRQRQANELAALVRESNEALRHRAEELKRKIQEEAAFTAAHRDLHDAVVDQQLASRRAEVMAEIEAFLERNNPT